MAVSTVTKRTAPACSAARKRESDRVVTAQIEAVAGDLALHATKIGMLATAAIVEAVAAAIKELELPLVVVDPVLASTSGERLLDADGVQALCLELMPLARAVTPNIPEAEALSGRSIRSAQQAREAARRIHDLGAASVIITGGHARWEDENIDLLFDGRVFHEFHTARIDTRHTHGTGCTFASAVAAGLALGRELPDAVARAQQYVAGAIAHALGIGHGRGPINHFWEHRSG